MLTVPQIPREPTARGAKKDPIAEKKPAQKPGTTAAAAPDPGLAQTPGEPTGLLSKALQAAMNPVLLTVRKARSLPAAPATPAQLSGKCAPTKLAVRWPPLVSHKHKR